VLRIVLDCNVFVSALLSPNGSPAQVLDRWADGDFDVVVSPLLLAELERVLSRPKFAASIDRAQVEGLVTGLMEDGLLVEDPPADPGLTPDPGTTISWRSHGRQARSASSRVMRICGSSRMPCRRSSRRWSSSSAGSRRRLRRLPVVLPVVLQ
jgi:hypothetical protein